VDDSQPAAAPESGLLAALRRLGLTLAGLLHTRLELVATELEEERNRILRLLLLALAAAFFLALGVVLLTFFIIVLAWESHRILAAGLLTAAYLAIGAFLAMSARDAAKAQAKLFAATLAELRKDRDELLS
jgi:uncharacterized membrane protein YqjE